MARFDIISKDGDSVRYSGKPRYNGVYLRSSYLEFSEIASPTPISWEVGDYIDYPRTGMRYRLYSVPQASKNARRGSHGRAFTYTNVQFFAATKELEIALFRDLVGADNNIHFSSSPDVFTFENVAGIARRIQACMDDFYPGRWEIRVADFDAIADAEIIKKVDEAKEFALSGGTCLDALSKIYELWQDIGWVHTNEGGKEVIIIGYPNKRIDENTTESFLYGKGNGLTAIKKNQTNKEEFATRLYVYGSERNLPPRYYNGKDILNAESVDIRNLMLPLDSWGKTDGLPDARKAYLENAEAVAKYGVIPKTHYFDSDDAGADIYPSITGMTIGMIRSALDAMGEQDSSYYPSEDAYPDSTQRVDLVRYCDNPSDDGSRGDVALKESTAIYAGKQRAVSIPSGSTSVHVVSNELLAYHSFSIAETKPCKVVFSPAISGYVTDDDFEKVEVKMTFYTSDSSLALASATQKVVGILSDGKWRFNLPSLSYDYAESPRNGFSAYIYMTITVTLPSGNDTTAISYVLDPGTTTFSLFPILDKTFLLRLHEIGFNINAQASLGKGKAISMKTGMCAGRTFLIESCRHKSASGYWDFTVKRQQDNTLGLVFPNKDNKIATGDEFVLLDIAMPELYILANSQKLLSEGEKLLARASKIQSIYEPSIDAKVMAESGRVLREGMFMEITDEDVVDNTTDYILIDTLSISEGESSIPTYKVTLKERRKVTYKGTPSATSATETESVEEDATSNTEVDVDLSDYYTKEEVNNEIEGVSEEIDTLADLLTSMWRIEDGKVVTDMDVLVKANLIVEGDTSSGGEGEDTPSGGGGIDEEQLAEYLESNNYVNSSSKITSLLGYTPANGANYLPLAGGRITGNYLDIGREDNYAGAFVKIITNASTSADYGTSIRHYEKSSGSYTYKGLLIDKNGAYYSNNGSNYGLIHSGNIGSQSVLSAQQLTHSNGTVGAVVNSSGNVTIGASDLASSGTKLLVSGSRSSISWVSDQCQLIITDSTNFNYRLGLAVLSTGGAAVIQSAIKGTGTMPLVINPNGGNIGIGSTATPQYKLDVAGTGRFTGGVVVDWSGHVTPLEQVGANLGTATTMWNRTYTRYIDTSSTYYLRFCAGGTEYMQLTDTGRLNVSVHIMPNVHNSFAIGDYSNSFNVIHANIYTSGASNNNLWLVGGASASSIGIQFARNSAGNTTGKMGSWDATGLYPATNNAYSLGTNSYMWKGVYTPLLQSAGGLDIVANGGSVGCRLTLVSKCFRSWSADAGTIDLGASTIQWRNVYAVNGIFSGDTSSGSDIRFKDIIKDKTIKIADIAKAPLFTFRWNDREDDAIHLGSSAQYWESVAPWLVSGEDFKTLNYAVLGVAMGISLAKHEKEQDKEIKALKRTVKVLEAEIKRLKEEMRYGS